MYELLNITLEQRLNMLTFVRLGLKRQVYYILTCYICIFTRMHMGGVCGKFRYRNFGRLLGDNNLGHNSGDKCTNHVVVIVIGAIVEASDILRVIVII